MNTRSRLVSIAALVSFAVACQAPPPPPPADLTDQDHATIRGMFDATPGYVLAGDWAAWAGQYSVDAVLQPPNAPPVTCREAIQAWGEAFPSVAEISFSSVQVMGQADLAYGTSAYTMTLEGAPADTGKQMAVFRRTPTGGWEVVALSFNSDLRIPER